MIKLSSSPALKNSLSFFIFIGLLSGCIDCDDGSGFFVSSYKPIYMARVDLDKSIQLKPATSVVNSGKIYVHQDLLYVAEQNLGFHVFDNRDTKSPENKYFLEVHGSTDVSIKGDLLYVNQSTDLLTLRLDYANENVKVESRIPNVFPALHSPDGMPGDVKSDSVLVNWELKQ